MRAVKLVVARNVIHTVGKIRYAREYVIKTGGVIAYKDIRLTALSRVTLDNIMSVILRCNKAFPYKAENIVNEIRTGYFSCVYFFCNFHFFMVYHRAVL